MSQYTVKLSSDDWGDRDVVVDSISFEEALADAAPIFWWEHDGWEWMKDGQIYDVRFDDFGGEVMRVTLVVECEPVFYGSIVL
ncbi:hypothetical protein N9Y00_08005 [Tateyamaria sp.]|nr:hypothetical protein [Tateyamaria sp.]